MKKKEVNLNSLSLDEKMELVEQICIIHPRMQAILDKIDYCRDHSKRALESIGMLVMGERGTGKTTIINKYVERYPIKRTKTSTIIPVLRIRIPVPATVGGLTACLLTALNDPFTKRGAIIVQTLRVYGLVNKCRVEVVMFDEFQHFSERESFKLIRTVSDWTKNFMGETKMPIIFFGTLKAKEILDGEENEQLKRRFPFRVILKPFGWETEEDQDYFRKFLEKLDEALPLPELSNLADPDMAYRICYATGGIMNEIMRLIRAAAVLALQRDLKKIDLDLLSESFAENLATNAPHLENPFKS
jgi:hypothetical protein